MLKSYLCSYHAAVFLLLLPILALGQTRIWNSYDVVLQSGSPKAFVEDVNGGVRSDILLYESTNDDGVTYGDELNPYRSGSHTDGFNNARYIWGDGYPYVGKSSVSRGNDDGEGNAQSPLNVYDFQMHPPKNNHLTVAAFIVPEAGEYSIRDLGVRRVYHNIKSVALKVFSPSKSLVVQVNGSNRSWSVDNSSYSFGALAVGDKIYIAVDNVDGYDYDAAEVSWQIEKKSGSVVSYTISASVGAGGSVSPGGITSIAQGVSISYSITPNTGYETEDVLVDGVSVGVVTDYQFASVQVNHTISATFAQIGVPRLKSSEMMSFSARLFDLAGSPVTGAVTAEVTLYTSEVGGTCVYTELYEGATSIVVTDGYFAAVLGKGITSENLKGVISTNDDLYVQISINGDAMQQRVPLTASPYSL